MIERTTFDLRLPDYATTTARINKSDWQRQGGSKPGAIRAALAAALVTLAARLDTTRAQRQDAALSPTNPA